MTVIPVLVNHYPDCEPSGGAQMSLAIYASGFRNPAWGYAVSFEDYATAVAQHCAHDRTVAFRQLVNEAETPGCPSGGAAALRAFAGEMRTALRSVDPNHLASLGRIGSGQCGASGAEYTSIHEGVDICEVHDENSFRSRCRATRSTAWRCASSSATTSASRSSSARPGSWRTRVRAGRLKATAKLTAARGTLQRTKTVPITVRRGRPR